MQHIDSRGVTYEVTQYPDRTRRRISDRPVDIKRAMSNASRRAKERSMK